MSEYYAVHNEASISSPPLPYASRRSPVYSLNHSCASSQNYATLTGNKILSSGGNAVAASIAIAAVLAVTEPCSTGLGGDAFALIYNGKSNKVEGINGSGRTSSTSPPLSTVLSTVGYDKAAQKWSSPFHALSVTVPGAVRMWHDLYLNYCVPTSPSFLGGSEITFSSILSHAITLAAEGFPVSGPVTSAMWKSGVEAQVKPWLDKGGYKEGECPLTVDGVNAPKEGEIYRNPDVAEVLRKLGEKGATEGFYKDPHVAGSIVSAVQKQGGCLTLDDLKAHTSTWVTPVSSSYMGKVLHEIPPPGQGIAGLIALKSLEVMEEIDGGFKDDEDMYHAAIEATRFGFEDARSHLCDGGGCNTAWMLDDVRIRDRVVREYRRDKAKGWGSPDPTNCTVSFQAVDGLGNSVSFVNSNYMGFGTGLVPQGCGFTLQNRGAGFTLVPGHPNSWDSNKRPYHTIIPAIVTEEGTGEFYATISNMGGFMQPQGHLQLMLSLCKGYGNVQDVVDRPRFCIGSGTSDGAVEFEEGFDEEVLEGLRRRGHKIGRMGIDGYGRSLFGRAQVIVKENGVIKGGSDGRADGCCIGG